MLIAVPTGMKIFNWLATMYGGRIRFQTPMLFCCAFLFQFLCAGLTGIMLSVAPFDWQLTDSYFVVAHFHFVLIGGLFFAIFGAIYYWFPKATGRMLSRAPRALALLAVRHRLQPDVPHHALPGAARHAAADLHLSGRPRLGDVEPRHDPRRAAAGRRDSWSSWSMSSSRCAAGKPAGDDPWDAWTLEWATTSPPPSYNFETLPVVTSRRPLWDLKHPDDPDWTARMSDAMTVLNADAGGRWVTRGVAARG